MPFFSDCHSEERSDEESRFLRLSFRTGFSREESALFLTWVRSALGQDNAHVGTSALGRPAEPSFSPLSFRICFSHEESPLQFVIPNRL